MEIAVTILSILFGTETLGFISFLIFLKLNKREKTTQVESQEIETKMHEIDLVDKYREKVLELEGQRDKFWTQQHTDIQWIKDTLNILIQYLDGGLQEWIAKHGLSIPNENKEE